MTTREIDGGPPAVALTGTEAWAGIQSGVDVTLTAALVNALPRAIASITGLQAALDSKVTGADFAFAATDSIVYVGRGTGASDANDGLSPGKAKSTLAAACAALPNGGVVQMLAGTFELTLTSHPDDSSYKVGVVVHSKTIVRGLGAVSVVKIANAQPSGYAFLNRNIAAGGDEGIVFEDFMVDGNNTGQSTIHHGITLLRTQNVKHNRVWIKNCRGTATSGINESFQFDAQLSGDVSYTDCVAYGTSGSTASGFSANGSTNVSYAGCRAWGMTVTNGFTHNACAGVTHTNCQSFLNGSHGFNSEISQFVTYDGCTAGGQAAASGTVTNKALTSNVATLTTAAAHGLATGNKVIVAGVGSPFDGLFTVASVPTTTTITYAKTSGNVASAAATGTVARGLGNTGNGLTVNDSTHVLVTNCTATMNNAGIGVVGTLSTGRIVGGSYSNNTLVGISFIYDAETRFKITGTPITTGNGSSPYALTSGFVPGPGLATAPSMPASGVALVNPFPFDATVIISGGTVNFVTVDGGTVLAAVQTVPVPFGKAITLNYSGSPVWVWILA